MTVLAALLAGAIACYPLSAEKRDAAKAGWKVHPTPLTAPQLRAAISYFNEQPGGQLAQGQVNGALLVTREDAAKILFTKGQCAIVRLDIDDAAELIIFGERM